MNTFKKIANILLLFCFVFGLRSADIGNCFFGVKGQEHFQKVRKLNKAITAMVDKKLVFSINLQHNKIAEDAMHNLINSFDGNGRYVCNLDCNIIDGVAKTYTDILEYAFEFAYYKMLRTRRITDTKDIKLTDMVNTVFIKASRIIIQNERNADEYDIEFEQLNKQIKKDLEQSTKQALKFAKQWDEDKSFYKFLRKTRKIFNSKKSPIV